ncbi:unnamed protein product [Penicillium camemberti]|uniref:Str. FM013 n=1 Tax=Penicillium camemberti (strain FM 013) TaxID=1429867 RepID=A0A0G4P731_PENC3|nr:unnamed protein product [Penicillium camemberti]
MGATQNQAPITAFGVPPPNGTKLADEGVYMATKYPQATKRASRWPVDFDRNGHICAA